MNSPYDAYRLLIDALKKSPDNLPAQADAVVATKDAQKIFEFVRDNIATYPASYAREIEMRWGVRGTLRGGAGTPRERAELLVSLYKEAGFDAEVVSGVPAGALAASNADSLVYGRTIARVFQPGPPPAPYTSWTDLFGEGTNTPAVLDAKGAESGALFDQISKLLPAGLKAQPLNMPVDMVPLVKVTVSGKDQYANPMLPNATFGTTYTVDTPGIPGIPPDPTQVKVTLSVSRSDAPLQRIQVATATYGLDQLVGRQLIASFHPPDSIESLFAQRVDQIRTFMPVIAVSGIDMTTKEINATAVAGSLVTVGGDVIETTQGGGVAVNGTPLDKSAIDPAAASKVSSLSLGVTADTFPQIELSVSALDSGGNPVPGLAAGSFALTEDGIPVQLLMRQNGGDLRVLFLLDESGSEPAASTDAAGRAQLGTSLGKALFAKFPNAKVQVVAISGGTPTVDGYTATTTQEVSAAFQAAGGGTLSTVYQSLAEAAAAAPSAVIAFSDFFIDDDPTQIDGLRAVAATGAPVLCIGTSIPPYTVQQASMKKIAKLTGGTSIAVGDMSDLTPVKAAIQSFLRDRQVSPYRFSYQAPLKGKSTRQLVLAAGNGKASGSYQVPASPQAPHALAGIYLELDFGGIPVVRTLAGWDKQTLPKGPLPQSVLDDVRAALLGGVLISFEGGPPSLSTWLTDLYSCELLSEPAYLAAQNGDSAGFFDALKNAPPVAIPAELVALHTPLATASGTELFEQAARAVLYQFRGNGARHADIFPFTRFTTFGAESDAKAFKNTLRGSLRLAVAEKTLFTTSAASELAGKSFKEFPPGNLSSADLPFFPQAEGDEVAWVLNEWADCHRLVAKDGSTHAFWAVDPQSGSAFGVLGDGSGGGNSALCQDLQGIKRYFQLLALLNEFIDMPCANIFLLLGKFVAIAGIETQMCFADGGLPPGAGDLSGLLCSWGGGKLGGALGKMIPDVGNQLTKPILKFMKGLAVSPSPGCTPLPSHC